MVKRQHAAVDEDQLQPGHDAQQQQKGAQHGQDVHRPIEPWRFGRQGEDGKETLEFRIFRR
jgi:hypothetical protein